MARTSVRLRGFVTFAIAKFARCFQFRAIKSAIGAELLISRGWEKMVHGCTAGTRVAS